MIEATDTAPAPRTARPGRHAAVAFVVVVALLNAMASMIIVPVLPQLVERFTGSAGHAAQYVGVFAATFALVQFIASPVLGALSDRYGRRAVILLSAFGMGADFLVMALAPSVGFLFVGRAISGVTSASTAAVNAYIADVTPPERRAGSFGWTGAAFAAGFLVGPALGGFLGEWNLRLPFWVSAGLCMTVAAYGWLVLPESLPADRRTPFSLRRASPLGAVRFITERPQIAGLMAVLLAFFLAQQCLPNTLVLYTGYRYGWSSATVGSYLTAVGVGSLFVQAFVVKRFVARLGERAAVLTGFAATAVAFCIYAAAPAGAVFVFGMPFFVMAGLIQPGLQSLLTRRVGTNEQGRLQGTNAALMALAGLIGPMLYTQVFAFAVGPGQGRVPAGAHLYLGAAILAAGALLTLRNVRARAAIRA